MDLSLRWRAAFSVFGLLVMATIPVGATTQSAEAASAMTQSASSSKACGSATIRKPNGKAWVCTFGDDFSNAKLDTSKWRVQLTSDSGFVSGSGCFVNSKNNVSVAGGVLSLTARKETKKFTCSNPSGDYSTQYTSGTVSTYGKFAQTYGRFEVRAKFPASKIAGLQSALWLYPQKMTYGPWPSSGEIDIAEAFSSYPDRVIPYIHYGASAWDPNVTNNYCMIKNVSAFHTYVAEWTPTTITIKYDGTTCLVDTWHSSFLFNNTAPFDQPFFVTLTQALGITGNSFSATNTPLPATTQVDYVHVWS